MSLVPMLFSDWWEDLHRPHRLRDQQLGLSSDWDDFLDDLDPMNAEVLLYRPRRRNRRRYHPFLKDRKRHGASTVQPDKDKFQVTLDVAQFAPDEITVKVVDRNVVVEAKHDEKEDEHGWVSRQFVRKYMIPSQCDIDQVESHLSSDGVLTITAPRKEQPKSENEKPVKIQYTGKPAVMDYEPAAESSMTKKDEQPQQRGQQQQQQQPQQQQGQRGRKGTVKAA